MEECLATLEGANYGLCFSSGLGTLTTLLGLFKSGDHIICGDDVFGYTYKLLSDIATRLGFRTSFVDVTNLSNIEQAIKTNTKVIIEQIQLKVFIYTSDL